jgi:hypothetical protein
LAVVASLERLLALAKREMKTARQQLAGRFGSVNVSAKP